MGMMKEFKEFAMKGNIAVIIGGAFGKIVTALTSSIIMPIISMALGKDGISDLTFTIGGAVFTIGLFLQAVIDFILIALVLFLIIKVMNARKKQEAAAPAPDPEEIVLLREIRDSLKK